MLQNIPQVNQIELINYYRFAVKNKQNLLVFGPSGTGKTEMALQACKLENYEPLYWNLSVSERPDIQGLPYVADNGKISAYAAPAQLPVTENKFYKEKTDLEKLNNYFTNNNDEINFKALKTEISKRLNEISISEQLYLLNTCKRYIKTELANNEINKKLSELNNIIRNTDKEIILFFDELDKAPPEVLQPLLEIMQFRTLNGQPLAIRGCIATANLPDEHTHSEQISHALTNRCMVFQLTPDFETWKKWAYNVGINPLILGFLSAAENIEYFHKKPQNNELHTYAYATPRSWTEASKLLNAFYNDENHWCNVFGIQKNHNNYSHDEALAELDKEIHVDASSIIQARLIASKVGETAASAFRVWIHYYQKLSPVIETIYAGNSFNIKNLDPTKQMILAIGVHNKMIADLKKLTDKTDIEKIVIRTYKWLKESVADEFRLCATRSTVLANINLFIEKKVHDIPYYREIQFENYNKIKSYRQEL